MVQIILAQVNQGSGVESTDEDFAIDNPKALIPIGGIINEFPTVLENTFDATLADDDWVLGLWNDTDEQWESVPIYDPFALRWGKIQETPPTGDGSVNRTVNVKECDLDGGNERGDAFDIETYLKPRASLDLEIDDIVGWCEDKQAEKVLISDPWAAGGGVIQYGKVTSWTNVAGDAAENVRTITLLMCSRDGTVVGGSLEVEVILPLTPRMYTGLFEDDIVGYIEDDEGDNISVTDVYDQPFGAVMALDLSVFNDPAGELVRWTGRGWEVFCDDAFLKGITGEEVCGNFGGGLIHESLADHADPGHHLDDGVTVVSPGTVTVPSVDPETSLLGISHADAMSHSAAQGKDGHPKWVGVIHLRRRT